MIYTYPDAEAKPAAPKLPAAGGQPPPEPTFLVGPEPTFLGYPLKGEGYPLKVVAEHVADDTQVTAALVRYCFVYPRTHMYLVKKKWGEPYGLPPAAVLLEDANGTSLSDGSIPEEMGWTIASPSDPPVCTVYVVPNEDWEGW